MNQADRRRGVLSGALATGAFIVYGATMAPGLTWLHDGADGGDLVRAAALGSVPHPTGYPTYLLLARLFLLLPAGDEAFRLNLMSAVCTAAAIGLFGAWQARGGHGNVVAGYAGAVTGALALAFAPLIWSQAIIAEVYGLHLLLLVALLALLDAWARSRRASALGLAGLVAGAGLGNHLTLVFLAPVMLVTVADQRPSRWAWIAFLAGLAVGASVYGYLPLASATGAPSPWGSLDSLGAWARHVSGEPYRGFLYGVPPPDVLGRLLAVPALAWNEFAPWGIVLAVVGGRARWHQASHETAALAACALVSVLFSIGYNTADAFRYLTVAWLAMAIWIAKGGQAVFAALRTRAARPAVVALIMIWLAATGLLIGGRWHDMDASADREAETGTLQALTALPPAASLVVRTDRQTFALWYYIDVRHMRPDVAVIDRDLFAYAPYRAYLSARWLNPAGVAAKLEPWIAARGDAPVYVLDPTGGIRAVNAKEIDAATR